MEETATAEDFSVVRLEGERQVRRILKHYNLDAIISVGYRVKSHTATRFRQWATRQLREYIVKGFVMDDERLKNPDQPFDYFDELLRRIQDIRTSEKRFYRKITDIYATSVDYDPTREISIDFFKTVQNKMHWAIHGHTAAELIQQRADSAKPNLGLSNLVANISCEPGLEHIAFSGGQMVRLGAEIGGLGDDMMRAQVYETVEQHLKKEHAVVGKGIKVLSLFFIDKVANYRVYHDDGSTSMGKIGQWFEEAYNELTQKPLHKGLLDFSAEQVHDGYFSQDRKGAFKDTSGKTKNDEDTLAKIMRNKEQLLSNDEPLRFIFSHTALREGWDNPNVFQICTLNETRAQDRKRQEIGRGLRLPVDEHGERVFDPTVNRLTVIANESYDDFARQLQTEYEEDYGIGFGKVDITAFAKLADPQQLQHTPLGQEISQNLFDSLVSNGYLDAEGRVQDEFDPKNPQFVLALPDEWAHMRSRIVDELNKYVFKNRVVNVRDRKNLELRKNITLDPTFRALWDRINQKTRYRVTFDTDTLVAQTAKAIAEMPRIHKPRITTALYRQNMSKAGIMGEQFSGGVRDAVTSPVLPDILAYLQNSTELTRHTLVRILKESRRLGEFLLNPQVFINQVSDIIQRELHRVTVNGIEYEKIGGVVYEMHRMEQEAERGITRYLNNLYEVQNQDKTLFNYVEFDFDVEKEFAKACDFDDRVKFYCKLPPQFKVDTPVGPYNPDWALVTENEEKLYLIRETKSTRNLAEFRDKEKDKITCGKKHFEAIGVDYDVVTTLEEALNG